MGRTITLRPITEEDAEFLYRVYASTRVEELAPLTWDDAHKEAFLRMQFQAQHTYYVGQFPHAEFQVILADGEPVGRLYLDRREDELHIIDIALLTAHRNQGIGSFLLNQLIAEANQAGLPVRIYVERYNLAMRLYGRLGFQRISDEGVYWLLERPPGDPLSSPPSPSPSPRKREGEGP